LKIEIYVNIFINFFLVSSNSTFLDDILSLFQENEENENENYDNNIDENISNINIPKIFNYYINNENNETTKNDINKELNDENSKTFSKSFYNCKYSNNEKFYKNSKKNSEISPIKIILGEEKRTTILIKNIPTLYKPKELLNELMKNELISGKFNYFYLPYNNEIHHNYGFAVINFINPFHTIIFFELYQKNKFLKYINEDYLELIFLNYNIFNTIVNDINNLEILIPLKYKELFKKIYKYSVCITIEKNFYNEGLFKVKNFGNKLKVF